METPHIKVNVSKRLLLTSLKIQSIIKSIHTIPIGIQKSNALIRKSKL